MSLAAELRAFIAALDRRRDITVYRIDGYNFVGEPASPAELASLDGLPDELVDFYREMNGVLLEWTFTEPSDLDGRTFLAMDGRICVPRIGPATRFTTDAEHHMGFGAGYDAMSLDGWGATGTWLVRAQATGSLQIAFAYRREGVSFEVADSIAAYFRAAIAHAFVEFWPCCFNHGFEQRSYLSYAQQEASIVRYRTAPARIEVGTRVEVAFFPEIGRGEVLELHEAPASRLTDSCGTRLARVQLDEGSVAWLAVEWIRLQQRRDAYQRLRDPAFDLGAAAQADLLGVLTDIARAIGGFNTHQLGGVYSLNGRRAAGLLSWRPLAAAIRLVADLQDATVMAKLDDVELEIERTGDEFRADQFSYNGKEEGRGILTGLFNGLAILARHASSRRGVPGRELVDEATIARLAAMLPLRAWVWDEGAHLAGLLASADVLAPPDWTDDEAWSRGLQDQDAAELALPTRAPIMFRNYTW